MSEQVIYIDGELINKSEAKISVFDHGLLYGDGIFEGIRAYNGKVFLCREHLDRLYEGSKTLMLDIPLSKSEMREALYKTMEANNLADGYIRLVVTRGVGDLGLNPFNCPKPSVIIIAASIQLYPEELYEKGLKVVTVATPAVHPESLNPRIKSLNYLNNILAKIETLNAGGQEGIMLNHKGEVAECTADNIFVFKNGVLKTPPVTSGLLEGCTRNIVMKIAADNGYTVDESIMQRYDLYSADEAFLSGTAAEVVPMVDIDGRKIGNGNPGENTLKLLKLFRDFIATYEDNF